MVGEGLIAFLPPSFHEPRGGGGPGGGTELAWHHDYIDAWKMTPARDTDGRERLWQAINIVAKIRDHLIKVVNDGKLSQRHLSELARRSR